MKTFKTVPSFTMPIDTTVSSGEAFVGGGHFIMEEIWKDIKEYEGEYEVSNFGRVKSKKHNKEIILKGGIDLSGYHIVSLSFNTKQTTKTIHRLVAEAFIVNFNNKKTVNHINGIKTDNRECNLEWNTYSENHLHAFRLGLNKSNKHVSVTQYSKFGNFIRTFNSIKEASRCTGVKSSGICMCAKGKSETAGKYKWKTNKN
jgi:hypothetical protein